MLLQKKCIHCGTELTEENTYEGFMRHRHYVCKDCWRKHVHEHPKNPAGHEKRAEYMKKWIKENKEHWLEIQRSYKRRNYLTINGKTVRGKKRLYPEDESCEVCKKQKRLHYHHWDNADLSKGVWVCIQCHFLIEVATKPDFEVRLKRYLELKQEIEQQSF